MATRSQHRDTTEAAIVSAGLRLLAEGGAEELTVRGLARELHLVPSALYRYVTNREDLLSLLLTHAYSDLADTIQAAHDAVPCEDIVGRWRAFAFTLRGWSLAHRHEWLLIQRSVVSGPRPFGEHTFRLHWLLLKLGADAEAAGLHPSVCAPTEKPVMPGLPDLLTASGAHVSEQTVLAGLAGWHLLDGVLYTELLQLAGSELMDPEAYYAAMVSATEILVLGDR
ncbi:MAG: TetR/AcrR family transcriptional regulator [Propionicimonas sp.]|uniref:TetR/AcrR family transcriptional regulator n=1 Tax=Propionicimonas sp. TaxID=1955623 RepID=UPI003D1182E5